MKRPWTRPWIEEGLCLAFGPSILPRDLPDTHRPVDRRVMAGRQLVLPSLWPQPRIPLRQSVNSDLYAMTMSR